VKTDADAWLETIGADTVQTIGSQPTFTIVPRDSGGARAMALLAELAKSAPVASLQLRTGDVIGEGGMGVVRLAEQVSLGRTVAVKTLKPGRRDPAAALDLLREAWVTGAIEHPNVVPVHYLGADSDGSPVIVLKRIEGVAWHELIADAGEVERRFGATDLLAWNLGILMQVLNAVRFAHHRGVIHRDLKPANVMIGDYGEVYLLDWGIAVSLRDDGTGRLPLASRANDLAGTPCYMAPEMLGRDKGPPLSERTDVYLAGAVLFELITGQPPHSGTTALEVIASVILSRPTLPASVPAELARICLRAMHEDPAQRFDGAEALRLAIQGYLEHRGSAELVTRAHVRLDELHALLRGTPERDELYRVFGACRFGFHEALAVWRENADASAGLLAATTAVAEYELAHDNPDAAVTLLTDLADPPPLLAKAREASAARHDRTAELERMRAEQDATIGRRTRTTLVVGIAGTFTVLPLIAAMWPKIWPFTAGRLVELSALSELAILLFCWWAWGTLGATQFNRRMAASGIFVFAAQTILSAGMWIASQPPELTQTAMQMLWGSIAAMMAIAIDPWFTPTAVAYFAGFLFSSAYPEHRLYVIAIENFILGVNGYFVWKPETFRLTADERAWLDDRKRKRG
jgi:serine/threonine-protein kinase